MTNKDQPIPTNNPYIDKLPITKQDIIDSIIKGGCCCVWRYIKEDIEKLKASKKTKAKLWEMADKRDWGSC